MRFWIPWAVDAIIAVIFVCFFIIGLGDGSVSSFNMALWLTILGGLALVLFGSLKLRSAGQPGLALALVLSLAIPGILVGLFFLSFLIVQPNWQ